MAIYTSKKKRHQLHRYHRKRNIRLEIETTDEDINAFRGSGSLALATHTMHSAQLVSHSLQLTSSYRPCRCQCAWMHFTQFE